MIAQSILKTKLVLQMMCRLTSKTLMMKTMTRRIWSCLSNISTVQFAILNNHSDVSTAKYATTVLQHTIIIAHGLEIVWVREIVSHSTGSFNSNSYKFYWVCSSVQRSPSLRKRKMKNN